MSRTRTELKKLAAERKELVEELGRVEAEMAEHMGRHGATVGLAALHALELRGRGIAKELDALQGRIFVLDNRARCLIGGREEFVRMYP